MRWQIATGGISEWKELKMIAGAGERYKFRRDLQGAKFAVTGAAAAFLSRAKLKNIRLSDL